MARAPCRSTTCTVWGHAPHPDTSTPLLEDCRHTSPCQVRLLCCLRALTLFCYYYLFAPSSLLTHHHPPLHAVGTADAGVEVPLLAEESSGLSKALLAFLPPPPLLQPPSRPSSTCPSHNVVLLLHLLSGILPLLFLLSVSRSVIYLSVCLSLPPPPPSLLPFLGRSSSLTPTPSPFPVVISISVK